MITGQGLEVEPKSDPAYSATNLLAPLFLIALARPVVFLRSHVYPRCHVHGIAYKVESNT